MWCAIHGNTLLGTAFLEGVKAERYLQVLNGVWELHVDEMPLVVRRFDFLQEVRKLSEEVLPGRWIGHRGPIE